ncbi:MAG: hypothetical protein FJW23_05340 [Acidimicrobiia bacterium]|nr:hypothetical protein [Acidimicrobiia bacterium]
MQCRQCGTEIADKALICFRCGTATSEPVRAPAPVGRGKARTIGLALLVLLLLALLAAWWFGLLPRDASAVGGVHPQAVGPAGAGPCEDSGQRAGSDCRPLGHS